MTNDYKQSQLSRLRRPAQERRATPPAQPDPDHRVLPVSGVHYLPQGDGGPRAIPAGSLGRPAPEGRATYACPVCVGTVGAKDPGAGYTPADLKTEWQYRFTERLGILCGAAEPTPEQVQIATREANEAIQQIQHQNV